MSRTVDFHYDFSSPNAYFAFSMLQPIAKRQNATIVYRPFFLGGLFKLLNGPQLPGMVTPEKAANSSRDLVRWSEKYQIPFRFPSRFPMNTLKALRIAMLLPELDLDHHDYAKAVFDAYWVDDADLADSAVLAKILEGLGKDGERILTLAEDAKPKDALKAATEAAKARGVFGAPTCFVGEELFFGKDRLDFVEDALQQL
jgi:2-hydroxychromene-2-carboxylate isomerase